MKFSVTANPLTERSTIYILFGLAIAVSVVIVVLFAVPYFYKHRVVGKIITIDLTDENNDGQLVRTIYLSSKSESNKLSSIIRVDDKEYTDWTTFTQSLRGHWKGGKSRYQITGDDNVPLQEIVKALDACRENGISDISIVFDK